MLRERLSTSADVFPEEPPDQRLFLNVRVFDLRNRNLNLQRCYKRNEDEEKKAYNEMVLEEEFATNGGMARECKAFYKRLAQMISKKLNTKNSASIKLYS